jgi:tRNA pseudouridine13 synthase
VPLEGPELDDARARAEAGAISATGPMFGAKMRWPEGDPARIEREVLAAASEEPLRFEAWKHLGEGTRRPLRLMVAEMEARVVRHEGGASSVIVAFVLPKGGYATTVLGRVCRLSDASREARPGAESAAAVDGASGDVQEA